MGYRSEVAGIISVDRITKEDEKGAHYQEYDKDKFKEMIGFIKLSSFYEKWNTTDEDQKCFGWEDGYFVFYGSEFKWYPDYEDVKAWHDMWNQMQDIEGISGYFCRVGEESDDVATEEFGDDPCYEYFHPFTALRFDGENFLGKRITEEEV
jgi:hypothetical protein